MKSLLLPLALSGLAVTLLLFISCDSDSPTGGEDHYANKNWSQADLSRGGLLYDKWWKINSTAEPTSDFDPLWSTQSTNARSGSTTWRCKECHGWDYKGIAGAYASGSHMTGFIGVFNARSKNRTVVFDAIVEASKDHDFSTVLSDADVLDLTKFVIDGTVDMNDHINLSSKAALGDVTSGKTLYDANCASCHGADGTTINVGHDDEPEFVGTKADDNPWETLHKIRFGHPGSSPEMPSMVDAGLSEQDHADILAYTQSLPADLSEAVLPDADHIRGGLLYDKWWKINNVVEPTSDFDPLWGTQSTNTRSGSTTWRCKECHGWDYQGVAGAYSSGSHMTGFAGVWNARTNTTDQISAAIISTAADHDFSSVLADQDVQDLTKFVAIALIDMNDYISLSTKEALGDTVSGKTLYDSNCSSCHGADGTTINLGHDNEQEFVGTKANDNPWETLHKIRFGHPGSSPTMPSMVEQGLSASDHADILTYSQTLTQ